MSGIAAILSAVLWLIKFAAVPTLAPGDKLVYRIVCRAAKVGSDKNRAFLRFDQSVHPVADEEGTSVSK